MKCDSELHINRVNHHYICAIRSARGPRDAGGHGPLAFERLRIRSLELSSVLVSSESNIEFLSRLEFWRLKVICPGLPNSLVPEKISMGSTMLG